MCCCMTFHVDDLGFFYVGLENKEGVISNCASKIDHLLLKDAKKASVQAVIQFHTTGRKLTKQCGIAGFKTKRRKKIESDPIDAVLAAI